MPSQHAMTRQLGKVNPSRSSQSGVAVLAVTVVLLLVLSVMGLYANRAIWQEQKTASNQYRAKQAMEAAEAGLEYMIGVLNVKTSGTAADELYDYLTKDSTTGSYNLVSGASPLVKSPSAGQVFSVTLSAISGSANAPPTKRFLITSTGGSDCSSTTSLSGCQSRAIARIKVRLTGPMANPPDSSLVVLNDTTLSGSSCIVNNSNSGKAVRTGKSVSVGGGGGGGGGAGKGCTGSNTTILNGNQSAGSCPPSGTSGNSSCTDPAFVGLTGDAFFNLFFGTTKAELKSSATQTLTNTQPTEPANGELVWVDITSNSFNISGNRTYGTVADPVIIILNGDADIQGNVTIRGVLYVTGNLTLRGTLDIEGAVIVEGAATVTGNAQIGKNPDVLNSVAGGNPPVMKLMGSWKDW